MEFHACARNHPMQLRAASGSLLCGPCIEQVEGNLRALPPLYQESLHHIAPVSRRMSGTRVSGSRSKDHLNMSALDARRDIVAILESWSEFVVDERGRAAPSRSVPQLTRMLLANVAWLAAQPPAADFADEIEDLKAELLRAIDPGPGDGGSLNRRCVVAGCPGVITSAGRGASPGGRSSIGCSSGHSWDMHEWITLRPLVTRERKAAGA
ncbi:hypothetical protein [Actinacidiphila acidipaludis]|uniref:Uncharacterized protein n=1 Tax=Actinacidiphila acidipaludis TaxID=2873382 RepID=A0ABS7QGT2_9ACTN|nr:hypothetical protein [Streptomyces acidipaludis]MBY8882380.1 hypothetical protein [Streptomyces acidipaludis]